VSLDQVRTQLIQVLTRDRLLQQESRRRADPGLRQMAWTSRPAARRTSSIRGRPRDGDRARHPDSVAALQNNPALFASRRRQDGHRRGVAQRISTGTFQVSLSASAAHADIGSLVAGTKYRGELGAYEEFTRRSLSGNCVMFSTSSTNWWAPRGGGGGGRRVLPVAPRWRAASCSASAHHVTSTASNRTRRGLERPSTGAGRVLV